MGRVRRIYKASE